MQRIILTVEGRDYSFMLDGNEAPADPIEQRGERHYIRMGFAGFNTRANNCSGYTSRANALAAIRKFQNLRAS